MSALAADSVLLEKMGVPVAGIGCEALIRTSGRAMIRAHGMPDYQFASVPGFYGTGYTDEDIENFTTLAIPQIERLLSPKAEG